ncbi:unnamed protein product [Ceutorhynchus assimilis]|uniref:Ion transport domain-containing protein n=1 Tax=Ceutorhynchus assimilis TaxID=467358 RepID=A0A9N9ME42_9CUCU|nr:unnamed protein product [Ceutorhynchus assimilis]
MISFFKGLYGFIVNWWNFKENDAVLKDYKSFRDIESSIQGFSSTSSTDNLTEISDSLTGQNHLPLHYDVILLALKDLSKQYLNIPEEIEWQNISRENLHTIFKGPEVNVGLLWATFLKRSDFLEDFLKLGAEITFYEQNYGLSPLHLASYANCKQSTEFLLRQKGCYVNLMCKCYSPLHCAAYGDSAEVAALLLAKGANIDAFTNDLHFNLEGVLHCAVRANAVKCLKLFCEKGANLNQLDSSGRTPIHLAAELGHSSCLEILAQTKNAPINQQTKEKQRSALHLATLNRHPDSVDILLKNGAVADIRDYRHRTPLHLSQCNDCCKLLLKHGHANPNLLDNTQKSPLHLACSKTTTNNCSEIIKTLIRYGANVDAKDTQGNTALHLAAQNELSQCVDALITSNADITAKSKTNITALGLICQKTPKSIEAIRKRLDDAVSFNQTNQLQIDFSVILQHGHPKESNFLKTLVDERQKDLLLHPVCTAFLHLKWKKIRKFFVFRALCCFLLVSTMSSYVVLGLAKHCYNLSQNVSELYEQDKELCLNHSISGYFVVEHPAMIEIEWYLMCILSLAIVVRKLYGFAGYNSVIQYLSTFENWLDWSTVVTVFLISFIYTGKTYIWQNHVSAFGILLAWLNFLYILGQFPFFGTYVAMYSSVQREFAKLFLVFACLLIGFTVSFCVLFPESEVFSNIYIGFLTILVMAIGEMNLDMIVKPDEKDKVFMLRGSTEIIYATFVTCVTIILLNLLVGIAVSDIQGLRKTAKLTKLVKATKLIYIIECALFNDNRILSKMFRSGTLVSSKGYCMLSIKLNNGDKVIPRHIIELACEVARKKCCKKRIVNRCNNLKNINISDVSSMKSDIRSLSEELVNMRSFMENNQKLMEKILKIVDVENDELL